MKKLCLAAVMAAVAGCANLPSGDARPVYDLSQKAVIAPGYPIERLPIRSGFELMDHHSNRERRGWDEPGSNGSSNIAFDEFIFGNTERFVTVGATFQQTGMNSRWKPLTDLPNYDFVNGQKVNYLISYDRIGAVSNSLPLFADSPLDCVMAVDVGMISRDQRHQFTGRRIEAIDCKHVTPTADQRMQYIMLQRTYNAFNLR